jgi:hypothetical protein
MAMRLLSGWTSGMLLLLTATIGCGGSGMTLVPLTGTLTLDGEPLAFKSVMLIPIDGTPGHGAGGYSDSSGKYTLRAIVPGAVKDFPGCPPGRYQVVVTEPQIPISDADFANPAAQMATETDEPAPAIALINTSPKKPAKGAIPAMYTSNRTSPLALDVSTETPVLNVELVSK